MSGLRFILMLFVGALITILFHDSICKTLLQTVAFSYAVGMGLIIADALIFDFKIWKKFKFKCKGKRKKKK